PLRRYSWYTASPSVCTVTSSAGESPLAVCGAPLSPGVAGSGIGLPGTGVAVTSAGVLPLLLAAAGLAGGATACTPGSFMPGGGGAGANFGACWLVDCAQTGSAAKTVRASRLATYFMTATSMGSRSIAARPQPPREPRHRA